MLKHDFMIVKEYCKTDEFNQVLINTLQVVGAIGVVIGLIVMIGG